MVRNGVNKLFSRLSSRSRGYFWGRYVGMSPQCRCPDSVRVPTLRIDDASSRKLNLSTHSYTAPSHVLSSTHITLLLLY